MGVAIVTVGPVTVAIMSTPRYVRKRNIVVVRYLYRTTRAFAVVSLGVLAAGLVLAKLLNDFSKPWLSVSLTLFVVSIVLLVLIMRDQRRAIAALEKAEETAADAARGLPARSGVGPRAGRPDRRRAPPRPLPARDGRGRPEDRRRLGPPAAVTERHPPAEPAHLLGRHLAAGMRRQPRVEHLGDPGMSGEHVSHPLSALAQPVHPHAAGLDAPQREPVVEHAASRPRGVLL